MKEKMMKLIQKLKSNKSTTLSVIVAAAVLLTLFTIMGSLTPGWLTWLITVPAWAILAITAAARVHDITANGKRWFVRRVGMIMVASGAAATILAPVLGYSNSFPSWRASCLYWGFALCWLTTPNMPPWWRYVSGEWRQLKGEVSDERAV